LPKSLLTKDLLLTSDRNSNSVAHYAARSGEILQFRKEDITSEVIRQTNQWGETVLHWAASGYNLKAIPKELLWDESAGRQSLCDETVFHVAAQRGCLHQLPMDIVNEKTMVAPKNKTSKATPLDIFISKIKSDADRELARKILKRLSIETLRSLKVKDTEVRKLVKKEIIMKKIRLEEEISSL